MSTWAIPSYAEWTVPGYTEERLLGHGVSGRVVAAVNDATGQRVAIKYLNANLARDHEFLAEFRSVAERMTSLNAPHAANVLDYVEQPGDSAAIVTELVDGVSLRRMLARRGPLSAKAALVVLKDSLLGLAAAHSRRVAHRDVKPDNVLIDATGWCTLTDFGIAVRTDKQMPAPGTPEYMAPELWNGAPPLPASDVYAATVVLCESLTGKPPFSGRAGRLRQEHESEPVPLDRYEPPLRDLIGWGMAKYSDRRPPSAWAFVGELDARASEAYGSLWEEEGRRELADRAEDVLALVADDGGASGGGSARVSRLARRKMLTFVSVAGVVLVVLVAAGAVLLSKKPTHTVNVGNVSPGEVSAQISGTTPVAVSKCSTPSKFTFTGAITDLQPGQVSYQWQYSTGQTSPVQTLNFTTAGQQSVTSGVVATTTAGDGWAQLNVLLNPGTKASNRVDYSLVCSSANSDITVSSKIAPAALNYSSCTAPHPTLTATGTITAKNPGLVTFYWQMSNGTKTTPVQLIFKTAGTQPVNPLTFQTWVPSAGNVVLVVTKPAVAASTPAVFSVTCPKPNYGPTAAPTTAKPTTAKPTTAAPTTAAPTTAAPTTAAPTTAAPTTAAPTTAAPTTAPPTTILPTGLPTA